MGSRYINPRYVLLLVDAGLTDPEAAQRLGVSRRTFQRRKYEALAGRKAEALARLNHPNELSPGEAAIIDRLNHVLRRWGQTTAYRWDADNQTWAAAGSTKDATHRLTDEHMLHILQDLLNLDAELASLFDAVASDAGPAYAGPTRARRRAPEAGPPSSRGGLDDQQDAHPYAPFK